MKLLSLVASTLIVVVAGFGADAALAQSKPEQELLQIENDWCTADLKQDAAILGRILASDFTGVGSRGITDTRESTVAAYKDKTSTTTACVNSNMKVRVFGDAAVVTGTVTSNGTNKGAAFKGRQVLFTDTYVRRDGRWQCVASQGTLVASQQK